MKNLITVFFLTLLFAGFTNFAVAEPDTGKKLYNDKKIGACSKCHKITEKKKLGPGLFGVLTRYDREFLINFIIDPVGMWATDDPNIAKMKKSLKREGKKSRMKMKVKLTSEQAGHIVDYLETLK